MNTPIDISSVVLTTDRLTLRPFRQSDLDDFFEYASVDGVGQMAGWAPHASKENSKFILDRFIHEKKVFAIEYEGKVVGSLGIEMYNEEKHPEYADKKCREIGFVLAKHLWGKGLMPEAVNRVIAYLFDEVGLDAIFCGHFLWNTQSARVQQKCGFGFLSFGEFTTRMNTVEKERVNILTKEEYERRKNGVRRVYFAGPLFNAAERDFNAKVASVLEENGYSVFLPQRDGILAATLAELSDEEKVRTVFAKDTSELFNSDVLVMIVDGRTPDEGACVELGLARASGKKCYGLKTDARALENGLSINPMIAGCFTDLLTADDTEALLQKLRHFLSNNAL